MALTVYQEIFCRMVASAAFRGRIVESPVEALAGLDLTGRERRRLESIARQPGMRVSTAIHRANRLSPLDQTLPFTCFLLGGQLRELVNEYWSENPAENLQRPAECARFAAFLEREIRVGRVRGTYIDEVLAFERAVVELKYFSADELRQRENTSLPPLVRILRFSHHPVPLLEALSRREVPPTDIETGDFYLLVDCRVGEPDFRLLDGQGLAALGWSD